MKLLQMYMTVPKKVAKIKAAVDIQNTVIYLCNKIFTMNQSQCYLSLHYISNLPSTFPFENTSNVNTQWLEAVMAQHDQVLQENRSLREQIDALNQRNRTLRRENVNLRRDLDSQFRVAKRKYTPRRSMLSKDFVCNVVGCKKAYSSIIALRNHQRIDHKINRKKKIYQE